jgi:hypothetical protein
MRGDTVYAPPLLQLLIDLREGDELHFADGSEVGWMREKYDIATFNI